MSGEFIETKIYLGNEVKTGSTLETIGIIATDVFTAYMHGVYL